ASPEMKNVEDLSPDGRLLIYNTNPGGNNATKIDLWLAPLEGERNPRPFLKTQFSEDQAVISPDGRWVAYRSDESGRGEIYVTTFPQLSGKWQGSAAGGVAPHRPRAGEGVFLADAGRKGMAVGIETPAWAVEEGDAR